MSRSIWLPLPGSAAATEEFRIGPSFRAEAARVRNDKTASYLIGMPLLPDYLEEALSLFDMSCIEFETGHL